MGAPALYTVCRELEEWLVQNNIPSDTSLHDQMKAQQELQKEIRAKEASDPLLRLYRFAYESITNLNSINFSQIKEEWDSVVESFPNARALKTINGAPDSMETLLSAIRQILFISIDETMNKKKLSEENETKNDTLAPLTVFDDDAVSKQEIVSPVHKRPTDDKSKFVRSQKSDTVSNSDDTKLNEPEDTNTDLDVNVLGQRLDKLCADDQWMKPLCSFYDTN